MTNHRMWYRTMAGALRQVALVATLMFLSLSPCGAQTASLTPNGEQQFLDNTGVPLASGKVYMYVPNTSTFKTTWQDSAEMTQNTNPITLDAAGRALIYGSGVYRQVVQDSTGVTIYDALTTSTLTQTDVTMFIATATSTGSANAQIVAATTPGTFALTANYTLTFKPGFTNTGAVQLAVGSTAARNLMKPSASGPIALTGGEIVANQTVQVVYDGTQYVLNTSLPSNEQVNAQTGTTYTFLNSDNSKLVTAFNAGAQAYTLPQAGAAGAFLTGWFVDIHNKSTNSAGAVTITPTTSTIDAGSTLVLSPGGFARIVSDGTNYQIAYKVLNTPVSTPTVQRFTSGSAQTYTAPAGITYIVVRMVGGGGGGGAVVTNAGSVGTDTSFSTWTAIHGNGGGTASAAGGAGGTGGVNGTGTLIARFDGGNGNATGTATSTVHSSGGSGGVSPFGGAGANIFDTSSPGLPAKANTGSGGAGAGSANAANGGGGGGAGEYVEFQMTAAQVGSSATYTVGAGGNGGAAGTAAGGNGAAGVIIIREFYQ